MKYWIQYWKLMFILWNYKREREQLTITDIKSVDVYFTVYDSYTYMIFNTKRKLVKLKLSRNYELG